jgi:hypothetical protein
MSISYQGNIDLREVADQLVGSEQLDEFFNVLGDACNENAFLPEDVAEFFGDNIGRRLDDDGRMFLIALAKYTMQQFPTDFVPTIDAMPGMTSVVNAIAAVEKVQEWTSSESGTMFHVDGKTHEGGWYATRDVVKALTDLA